jgi:predicted MFS family arabinose efflux permease
MPAELIDAPDEVSQDLDAGNRVLAALCIASFLASLNFYAMTPFYTEIANDLDTTVPLVGQVATLMILISAGLGLAVGPLADRYGYRKPLVLGVLAVAVTLAGTGLATSYPMLLLVSITGGLADAMVFGLPLAIAGLRFSGEPRRRAISWTLGSLSSAPIIGIPILTAIGGIAGWRAAMISAGALAAGTAWFVAVALPPDDARRTTKFQFSEVFAAYKPLLRDPSTLRLYGMSALRSVTWIGLLTYLGAYLGDEIGLSTRQIGLVYTVGGIGSALGSFLGGRLPFRTPRTAVGVNCIASAISGGLMVLITDARTTVPLLFVLTFSAAVTGIAVVTLLAAESPAGTGTTMVLNGSVLNIGAAAGAALGGALLAIGGYTALGLGLPVFALGAAALAWWPHPDRSQT